VHNAAGFGCEKQVDPSTEAPKSWNLATNYSFWTVEVVSCKIRRQNMRNMGLTILLCRLKDRNDFSHLLGCFQLKNHALDQGCGL